MEEENYLLILEKQKTTINKDRKFMCFNCNIYEYMAKDCRKPKKEKGTRKCYKCNKVGYIAKDYKSDQKMKKRNIHSKSENEDKEDNNKEGGFVKGLEQVQYDKSLYIVIL